MGKFAIRCPKCGRYTEADTGLFARKQLDCACGYTIDIRRDRYCSRVCPSCGNTIVADQSKGANALCPVCGKTLSDGTWISCAQCGIRLQVQKNEPALVCPVCGHQNPVAERMMSEKIHRDGLASIIKYEGDGDTLVWKHPIEDFNYGSQLIVHESQEAVFFRDGQALDLFGAGRYTLETQQLPLLEKLYQLPTDTEGTFHSEVWFINIAAVMGIKWGTDSKVRLFDPATGMYIELGACGELNIRVINSRKLLLKLVGTTGTLSRDQLLGMGNGKAYFRGMVMTQVKSYLAQTIKSSRIGVLELDEHLSELSEALKTQLNRFLEDYGLEMPEFYITRFVMPDDDPNFRRMKEQYAEQYLLVRKEEIRKKEAEAAASRMEVEAAAAARLKQISVQGEADALRIGAQAAADAYRMRAEAEAQEMRMKGYSYQQETARQVGLEAMKNGIGSGAGAVGDLAGLGIGLGAVGGVMGITKEALQGAGTLGQSMGGTITAAAAGSWDCGCGAKGNTGLFCQNCGAKRPSAEAGWDCACGTKNIQGNFCPNCGKKRPEADAGWDCSCGAKGNKGAFCPNCGAKRPSADAGWDCECGTKNISSNFCPNCGKKKGA